MREPSKFEVKAASGGITLDNLCNTLTTFLSSVNFTLEASVGTGIAIIITNSISQRFTVSSLFSANSLMGLFA